MDWDDRLLFCWGEGLWRADMFGQTTGAGATTTTPGTGFSFGGAAKPAFSFGSTGSTGSTGAGAGAGATGTGTATGFSLGKPAAPAPSGFGTGSNTDTGTGFSFGAKPASTLQTPQQGLFGQQQQQPGQQASLSFNSQPSFSWSKPTSGSTNSSAPFSLTGQTQTPAPPAATATTAATAAAAAAAQPSPARDYAPTINDKLTKIRTSWDASNPQCTMVTHFYNKVDASFTNFTRPPNESPEEWETAMKNRPKEYNSIPVKGAGFSDLFERDRLQDNHVKQTRILLNQINDKLTCLNEKHDLHSNTMLLKCKMRQKNLNIKLLKIAINLSILKYKGYPLTNDEELLIARFNSLLRKLDDPVGLNRVNELWARLSSLKDKYPDPAQAASLSQLQLQTDTDPVAADSPQITDENSDVIKKLVKVLAKQQQGIQYLCELMEEDEATLDRLAAQ